MTAAAELELPAHPHHKVAFGHTLASPEYDKEDEIKLEQLGYKQARLRAGWTLRRRRSNHRPSVLGSPRLRPLTLLAYRSCVVAWVCLVASAYAPASYSRCFRPVRASARPQGSTCSPAASPPPRVLLTRVFRLTGVVSIGFSQGGPVTGPLGLRAPAAYFARAAVSASPPANSPPSYMGLSHLLLREPGPAVVHVRGALARELCAALPRSDPRLLSTSGQQQIHHGGRAL